MFTLEIEELLELVKNEEDRKLRAILIAVLCVTDRLNEHTEQIEKIVANDLACEVFTGNASITCKLLSGLGAALFAVLVGVAAYIFQELNTISFRQSGVLTTLEYIKEDNNIVASKLKSLDDILIENSTRLKSIETRNAAVDSQREELLNKHKFLP